MLDVLSANILWLLHHLPYVTKISINAFYVHSINERKILLDIEMSYPGIKYLYGLRLLYR
jgi:hypothetical protein